MKEQGNLLLAIVLSLLILLGFQYFFEAPKMKKEAERKKHIEQTENLTNNNSNNLEDDITGCMTSSIFVIDMSYIMLSRIWYKVYIIGITFHLNKHRRP